MSSTWFKGVFSAQWLYCEGLVVFHLSYGSNPWMKTQLQLATVDQVKFTNCWIKNLWFICDLLSRRGIHRDGQGRDVKVNKLISLKNLVATEGYDSTNLNPTLSAIFRSRPDIIAKSPVRIYVSRRNIRCCVQWNSMTQHHVYSECAKLRYGTANR